MAAALLKRPVEAPSPIAVEPTPSACAFCPRATEFVPAAALVPTATELVPFAVAFTPHPNDEASADAPLLLAVTELTTGINVGVASVRISAVVKPTLLTNEAVGAVTLATPVPVVGVTLVTAVPVT